MAIVGRPKIVEPPHGTLRAHQIDKIVEHGVRGHQIRDEYLVLSIEQSDDFDDALPVSVRYQLQIAPGGLGRVTRKVDARKRRACLVQNRANALLNTLADSISEAVQG